MQLADFLRYSSCPLQHLYFLLSYFKEEEIFLLRRFVYSYIHTSNLEETAQNNKKSLYKICISYFFKDLFFLSGRFPSLHWDFLHYFTMILQRIRIIVGDAGFEPGTSAPEVWCATNKPPHLLSSFFLMLNHSYLWLKPWVIRKGPKVKKTLRLLQILA